jgi:hypothetical protein
VSVLTELFHSAEYRGEFAFIKMETGAVADCGLEDIIETRNIVHEWLDLYSRSCWKRSGLRRWLQTLTRRWLGWESD